MKTFSEFIAEARGGEHWWGSGRPAAQKKAAQLRTDRNPNKMVANIKKGASIQKAINKLDQEYEKDKPPETMDTRTRRLGTQRINRGYASKPADTRARGGSLPNISSPDGEGPESRVTGRYGDLRTGRSGGVRSTMKHKGTSGSGEKFGRLGRA